MIISPITGGRPAMVVFVDHTECRLLRPLKRGFRHCFVALEHRKGWLVCDSLKSHMELALLELPGSLDLARCYADQGHHVLVGKAASPAQRPRFAVGPLTCVSVAKRLLAVRAAWVATPWQLFCHLSASQPLPWKLVSAGRPTGTSPIPNDIELDMAR